MLTITSSNVLKLTKGNSCIIDITPIDATTKQPVILQSGDKVLFTVKGYSGTVLQKTLTEADYDDGDTSLNCAINPEDTVDLPVGEYAYDCLYLTDDGQAVTFISSKFIITTAAGLYTDAELEGGANNG